MKLTLRKANALQNTIQEHTKTIEVNTSITLNEFQAPEKELACAREGVLKNDHRRNRLTQVLYKIRAKVGRANTESGVADLLADSAFIDKRLGQLKGLVDSSPAEELAVVEGKLKKLAETESKSRIYGYGDTVSTGVLTPEQIEAYKGEMRILKKEKQSINDKVLELNVRTEIELDADTVSLLKTEELI